jgi:hypothetical protein
MAGEEQGHAKRRDADESGGPSTPEGKAEMSWNAVKHALSGSRDVIQGEDPQEFERHRRGMLADLAPVGPMETKLAERIVSLSWRLQRAEWLQNEVMEHMLTKETENPLAKLAQSLLADGINLMGDDPEADPKLAFGRMVAKDFSGDGILDRLSIHEQKIESSLYGIMDELRRLQRLRKP